MHCIVIIVGRKSHVYVTTMTVWKTKQFNKRQRTTFVVLAFDNVDELNALILNVLFGGTCDDDMFFPATEKSDFDFDCDFDCECSLLGLSLLRRNLLVLFERDPLPSKSLGFGRGGGGFGFVADAERRELFELQLGLVWRNAGFDDANTSSSSASAE